MRGTGPRSTQRVDLSDLHLVEVPLEGRDAGILAARLWGFGAVGLEERPGRLIAAFPAAGTALEAADALTGGAVAEVVTGTTGLDESRAHAPVVEAGPFVVHPPWLEPAPHLMALAIDPGHAFGTGSHASTRLALRLIAEVATTGSQVIDVGCGSGVLSIAAARMGATVTAIDIEPAAVDATRANVAANGVAHLVEVRRGSVQDLPRADTPTDLVVVNVTIDQHEELAPAIGARLHPRHLIASGLLAGPQVARCVSAYRGDVRDTLQDGEWVALLLNL